VESAGFVEAVLEWRESGEARWVDEWLRDRGLQPIPMRHGLLVTGDRRAFSSAFGVDMDHIAGPASLPVPDALQDVVASVTLAGPKQITGMRTPRS
jgi:hypothetical protein